MRLDELFEDLPNKDCKLSEISIRKVQAFLVESGTKFKVNRKNLDAFLTSIGVYKNGSVNNAGVLMFAGNGNKLMPHSEIICGAFKGTTKTFIYDRKDIRDDLLSQLNEAMAFIQRQLNIRSEIRGLDRFDIYELPIDALREALVNAIIHRDYSFRGASISVEVYDDRVEIVSPGTLPAGLEEKNLGKISVRRNLILGDLFHRMGKVERIGSGIGRMKEFMAEARLEPPKFEITNFFRAVFYRNTDYSLKKSSGEKVGEKLSGNQRKILELITNDPVISARQLADIIGISHRKTEENIAKLKTKGFLRRVGSAKGGRWEIVK
ncbi:MAG TPA: hypothetical protein DD381_07425 [Lentisphaeria bacterium]|nr:MAG: hypothetical protein A2X47_04005 [Lentisphaerae bacterium GWF2_38_69]HBM16152.1 hypothetical protein [Lentisphaeria bacterium]